MIVCQTVPDLLNLAPLQATVALIESADKLGTTVGVLNNCDGAAKKIEHAKTVLASFKMAVAQTAIFHLPQFSAAYDKGKAVTELKPANGKAALQIDALWGDLDKLARRIAAIPSPRDRQKRHGESDPKQRSLPAERTAQQRDEQRREALTHLAREEGRGELPVLLEAIRGQDQAKKAQAAAGVRRPGRRGQPPVTTIQEPADESVMFDLVRLLTSYKAEELIKVRAEPAKRSEISYLVEMFRGRVVDISTDNLLIEISIDAARGKKISQKTSGFHQERHAKPL